MYYWKSKLWTVLVAGTATSCLSHYGFIYIIGAQGWEVAGEKCLFSARLMALQAPEAIKLLLPQLCQEHPWSHLSSLLKIGYNARVLHPYLTISQMSLRSTVQWPGIRAGWKALRAVKNGCVHLADGNAYFNRSGPRVVNSAGEDWTFRPETLFHIVTCSHNLTNGPWTRSQIWLKDICNQIPNTISQGHDSLNLVSWYK